MKHVYIFLAIAALTLVAFFPTAVRADELDDLDVTMEVLDDVADFDDAISEMRGPDDDDVDEDDWADGEDEDEEEPDETDDEEFDERSDDDAGGNSQGHVGNQQHLDVLVGQPGFAVQHRGG